MHPRNAVSETPRTTNAINATIPALDEHLVVRLLSSQFREWANLAVTRVESGGWDNRTFRLGNDMLVRLPSALDYASQVETEQRWLPHLAPHLPVRIPEPLAAGRAEHGFPWAWSIYRWLPGEAASSGHIARLPAFATDLAQFLTALHAVDTNGGPPPGANNFHRGGDLVVYDSQTRRAIEALEGRIDAFSATGVWERALSSAWHHQPVWVHGDISAGNLLTIHGVLSAVIDFGQLAVGDPACDLAIAWTLFHGDSRDRFRSQLELDDDTWARGRGWALWKALIVAAGLAGTDPTQAPRCWNVIDEILFDHAHTET